MTHRPPPVEHAPDLPDEQVGVEPLEDQLVLTVPARPTRPAPAVLVAIHAALDDVRRLLLDIGATSPDPRPTALALVDHRLVLDRDEADRATTVGIDGPNAFSAGRWLAERAKERGWWVGEVLPPMLRRSSGLALGPALGVPTRLGRYRLPQVTETERSA